MLSETPRTYKGGFSETPKSWGRGKREVAVMLSENIKLIPLEPTRSTVAIGACPPTPPDDGQVPQLKMSAPKAFGPKGMSKQRVLAPTPPSGRTTPTGRTSPSGHNPYHKIRQLMGVEAMPAEYSWELSVSCRAFDTH